MAFNLVKHKKRQVLYYSPNIGCKSLKGTNPIMKHILRLYSLLTLLCIFAIPLSAHHPPDVDTGPEIRLFCELKAKTNNFLPGETVQFEARIVNNSKYAVNNIRIVDFAPVGFIVEPSQFVDVGEQIVLKIKKPIQPGKERIVKFVAYIDEDLIPGLYTNLCKVVYAENESGQAIINEEQKWTSSPWDMMPTEALDFVRVLDPSSNESSNDQQALLYFKFLDTQYNKESNQVQVDFTDDDSSSVSYKLYNDSDRLKSTGRINSSEGVNTLNLDATYLEAGNYFLEMSDGVESIRTRITII